MEYEYSYKNTDDGVILSVVISKESMDNELVPVEDIVNNYANTELFLENYVKGSEELNGYSIEFLDEEQERSRKIKEITLSLFFFCRI